METSWETPVALAQVRRTVGSHRYPIIVASKPIHSKLEDCCARVLLPECATPTARARQDSDKEG